jgi:AcrR family transcriptional regulator
MDGNVPGEGSAVLKQGNRRPRTARVSKQGQTGRAKRQPLSRERIVAAALAVLDAEGLEGLSMRTVARELGTGAMSLYRHVSGREELLELVMREVIDGASSGLPPLPRDAPWRDVVTTLLGEMRRVLRAHPGVALLFTSWTFQRGAALDAVEVILTALRSTGLDARAAALAAANLWTFAVGSVLAEQSPAAAWPGEEIPRAQRARWVSEIVAGGRPRVAEAAPRWESLTHDEAFAHGLGLLLDGIEAAGPGKVSKDSF